MYVKVDHPEKPCFQCYEVFEPKTSHQNFCSKNCYRKYGKLNYGHSKGKWKRGTLAGYRKAKKDRCKNCGFIPIHRCQLDVDHIDGDHSNNDPSNLQTLCANCHRLKTYLQLWGP